MEHKEPGGALALRALSLRDYVRGHRTHGCKAGLRSEWPRGRRRIEVRAQSWLESGSLENPALSWDPTAAHTVQVKLREESCADLPPPVTPVTWVKVFPARQKQRNTFFWRKVVSPEAQVTPMNDASNAKPRTQSEITGAQGSRTPPTGASGNMRNTRYQSYLTIK